MHPADIIASLIKAGHPPIKVAETLGVTRGAVSRVINGNLTSRRIAKHISKINRVPLDKLWPDGRYGRRPRRTKVAA